MTHYLRVSYGSGALTEKSKEPKEGFEQYSWEAKGDIKAGTAYRKEYKGITGTLVGARLTKLEFGDKGYQFSISLKSGEDYYNIQVPVTNKYGNFDTYAESLLRQVLNMEKGVEYTVSTFSFVPQDSERTIKGFSVKQDGKKVEKALTYVTADNPKGDIPALKVTEKENFDGSTKKEYDGSEKTKFLFKTLKTWVETNYPEQEQETQPSNTTTKPKPQAEEPGADFEDGGDDDGLGLPF